MADIADISICIITYNQDKYIARAIDSALMQQGNMRFEIIISDDCSTDNTKAIIAEYAVKYPTLIKPHYAATNLGMLRNWEKALKLCSCRYIALLEGDDYWNDPLKLQKQFNILESNPDCVISFTNATIEYASGEDKYNRYVDKTGEFFTITDLLNYNFIPTCSVLMRNHISADFFPAAYFRSPFADWIIHILNSKFGRIHFLNEFTCTYLVHDMGVWGSLKKVGQMLNTLKALNCISEILPEKQYREAIAAVRKNTLQKVCAYFKDENRPLQYLQYRLKLFFA